MEIESAVSPFLFFLSISAPLSISIDAEYLELVIAEYISGVCIRKSDSLISAPLSIRNLTKKPLSTLHAYCKTVSPFSSLKEIIDSILNEKYSTIFL